MACSTKPWREWPRRYLRLALFALCTAGALALAGCSSQPKLTWDLDTSIQGHLPNLKFDLTDGLDQTLTGKDLLGKVVMVYFGYTHCPDVCPLTMTHLHEAMVKLGPLAKHARILFVSVDPARDTPKVLHEYVKAFDSRAIGATGSEKTIADLARRYRIAYNKGPSNGHGGYEVNHSAAIYIFDGKGHVRLLATPVDTPTAIAHDVRQLITQEYPS